MIRTTTEIDADIASLREAIASGAKRCRFADGREVEYQRADDLRAAVQGLIDERNALSNPGEALFVGRYMGGLG